MRRVSSPSSGQVARSHKLHFLGQPKYRLFFNQLSRFVPLFWRFQFRIGTPNVHPAVPMWDRWA